jgi:O-antigen/teichoic acid export membrane protein
METNRQALSEAEALAATEARPGIRTPRLRRGVAWGLIDQSMSSLTNFGLALLAGRSLGPRGLGVISIAFAAYLLLLGFQRALVTDPIVVASASWNAEARREAAQSALTIVFFGSLLVALTMAGVGWIVAGHIGHVFVLFGIWLVPALVQDFWRSMLFRDRRGAAAAANDGVWVLVMALASVSLWGFHSEWSIVGMWGLGALAGAVLGSLQMRIKPERPARAWKAWVRSAWPLGRWLGLESIAYVLGAQGVILLLATVISTKDIGGLRATQAIFAPLSLIGPALALPGLPALKLALEASPGSARKLALKLSFLTAGLTTLYLAAVGPVGPWFLRTFFGPGFGSYGSLIVPIGLGQVFSAWALGLVLFLKVTGRGRAILATRALGSAAALLATWGLATSSGVVGGAWGMLVGPATWITCATWIVLRRHDNAVSGETDSYSV